MVLENWASFHAVSLRLPSVLVLSVISFLMNSPGNGLHRLSFCELAASRLFPNANVELGLRKWASTVWALTQKTNLTHITGPVPNSPRATNMLLSIVTTPELIFMKICRGKRAFVNQRSSRPVDTVGVCVVEGNSFSRVHDLH